VALPSQGAPGISLRALADDTQLVMQPAGTLDVREIIVPLDIPITKFADATPSDGTQFGIANVTVNGQAVTPAPKQEDFAIAQFTDLSDADKVAAPSYELFDAGVSLGQVPLHNGHDSARTISYQEEYIDDFTQPSRFTGIYRMPLGVHAVLSRAGLAAQVATATTGLKAFATGESSPIAVGRSSYVIASTVDLTLRSDVLGAATTRYQAATALAAFVAAHPDQRDLVQVLPVHEAVLT
jgi:hypothetical protein